MPTVFLGVFFELSVVWNGPRHHSAASPSLALWVPYDPNLCMGAPMPVYCARSRTPYHPAHAEGLSVGVPGTQAPDIHRKGN